MAFRAPFSWFLLAFAAASTLVAGCSTPSQPITEETGGSFPLVTYNPENLEQPPLVQAPKPKRPVTKAPLLLKRPKPASGSSSESNVEGPPEPSLEERKVIMEKPGKASTEKDSGKDAREPGEDTE